MVEAALICAGILCIVGPWGWILAGRYKSALIAALSPIETRRESQPAEKAGSPAKYLYACSKRLGVSTQTLKDLGFTAIHLGDGAYGLEPKPLSPDLEALAREAMGEIAAECRAVGNRVQVPATSYRWIAKACREWGEQIEETRVASIEHRVTGTWE